MNDLVKSLENWAKRDTVFSEFGTEEHIAGMAAERIKQLQEQVDRLFSRRFEDLRDENEQLKVEIVELRHKLICVHQSSLYAIINECERQLPALDKEDE